MSEPRADKPAVNVSEHVSAGDFARSHDASGAVAGTGRTDAVSSGIVRPSDRAKDAMRRGSAPLAAVARTVRRNADDGSPEGDFGDESAEEISNLAVYTRRGGAYARLARNSPAEAGGDPSAVEGAEGPVARQDATGPASGSPGRAGRADAAKTAPRTPAKPNAGNAAEGASEAASRTPRSSPSERTREHGTSAARTRAGTRRSRSRTTSCRSERSRTSRAPCCWRA